MSSYPPINRSVGRYIAVPSIVDVMSGHLVEIFVALLSALGVKDSCLAAAAPDNGDCASLLCGAVFAELGQEDGDGGWDDEQEAEYVERKQVAYEVRKCHLTSGLAALLHVCHVVVFGISSGMNGW